MLEALRFLFLVVVDCYSLVSIHRLIVLGLRVKRQDNSNKMGDTFPVRIASSDCIALHLHFTENF